MSTRNFLDYNGLRYFSRNFFAKIGLEMTRRIATTINANSVDTQSASAKAVYNFVQGAITADGNINVEIVTTLPTTAVPNKLYLIKYDSTSEELYSLHMYVDNKWIAVGSNGTSTAGPKGDTGDVGPAGPKGDTGNVGPAGAAGTVIEFPITINQGGTGRNDLANQIAGLAAATSAASNNRLITLSELNSVIVALGGTPIE